MIYLIPIIAWAVYLFLPTTQMLSYAVSYDNLYGACTYVIAHKSLTHIILNTISLYILWIPVRKRFIYRFNTNTQFLSLFTYLAAVLAGFACASDMPTVGMSGMVFFLLGALLMLNPTVQQLRNYIWLALATLIQLYFGHTNVQLHTFAFTIGALYICILEFIDQYRNHTGIFSSDIC